ncbi:MAG: phospho-sugar mutase, partial [Planctomycetota bacterium]|nr:phospho-sugar mutase [Planctomycetota bacterium]
MGKLSIQRVEQALSNGNLSQTAAQHIRTWLTEKRYAEYVPLIEEHITTNQWQKLDDVFWTIIPFGTGGRRGRMYPIGSNAINDRTVGESAQGLATYVIGHYQAKSLSTELSCGIAYDTRHNSRHFAELCASI